MDYPFFTFKCFGLLLLFCNAGCADREAPRPPVLLLVRASLCSSTSRHVRVTLVTARAAARVVSGAAHDQQVHGAGAHLVESGARLGARERECGVAVTRETAGGTVPAQSRSGRGPPRPR